MIHSFPSCSSTGLPPSVLLEIFNILFSKATKTHPLSITVLFYMRAVCNSFIFGQILSVASLALAHKIMRFNYSASLKIAFFSVWAESNLSLFVQILLVADSALAIQKMLPLYMRTLGYDLVSYYTPRCHLLSPQLLLFLLLRFV